MNREKTMEKKNCSKKSYNKYMEDLTTIQENFKEELFIVGDSDEKVFVTGLPDTCEVIVVGQGFVMDNEIVKTISEAQLPDSQQ